MTTYEFLQKQKEHCEQMARIKKDDPALFIFYTNAAAGFEIKQNKLTLAEAAK